MPPLDDPRRMLAHAQHHLDNVEGKLRVFEGFHPRCLTREYNAKESRYVYRFEASPPFPQGLGLIVGDAVNNLRGALDHLVWQLAYRNTGNEPGSRLNFPMYTTPNSKGVYSVLRELPPAAQQLIEAMQPYHRGDRAESHLLWILGELSNAAKHRRIIPTWRITGVHVYGIPPRESAIIDSLNNGEVIVSVPRASNAQQQLDPQVSVAIVFGRKQTGLGVSLQWLRDIHDLIRDDVFPRFAGFFP